MKIEAAMFFKWPGNPYHRSSTVVYKISNYACVWFDTPTMLHWCRKLAS